MKKIKYFRFFLSQYNYHFAMISSHRMARANVETFLPTIFTRTYSFEVCIRSRCVFSFFLSIFSLLSQWMITAKPTRKSFFETSERVDVFFFFFPPFFFFLSQCKGGGFEWVNGVDIKV